MIKKITCLILSLIMFMSCFSVCFGVSAADDVMDKLYYLVEKFPDGKYWNHMGSSKNSPDTWTNTPCASHSNCHWAADACSCNSFDNAIQCMGYAYKIAYELVGASARTFTKSTTLDASRLRVGDVIRYNGHSICVTGVKGNEIAFTDNNYTGKCKIRWSRMNLSSIKNFSYVLHHGKSGMNNSDLDFYTDVKTPDEPVVEEKKQEIWQMGSDALNIRASASTGATVLGIVPANAKFYVYEKKSSDKYLWSKIKYGSVTGWSVLNYSEYISGKYEVPEIQSPKEKYPLGSVSFKWSQVSGADKYQIRIYDKDKELLSSYYTTDTEYKVPFGSEGSYYAKVYAFNQFCDSWKIDGELISFTIEGSKEDSDNSVDEIGLPEALALVKGSSKKLTLNAADNSKFTWHSENVSVATVTADGEITANNFGKTKIGCTSSDGKTTAFCTVTVTPGASVSFKQNPSKTTTKAIPLSWSAVAGATGYQVARYNSATKKYDRIAVTTSTSYTDKKVAAGKDYYYVVRAYAKTEQGYVYGEYVKIKCSSDPAKVTGLKQSASSTGTVTLKWNKVSNADAYTVYRYDSKTKKYSKIKATTKNSLKISQKAGSSYYYRVYATTKTDWGYTYGTASDAALATSGPSKVSAKVTNAGTGRVKISWSKVSGATHYEIYRYGNDGYTKIATIGAQYGSFTNINLRSNRNYYYRVRAVTTKNGYTACGSYSDKLTIKTK